MAVLEEPKRICFLLPTHFSYRMGGAEYQVKSIIETIRERDNFEIVYLCRRVDLDFVPDGYSIRRVGSSRGLGRYSYAFDFRSLYKALQELNPDIIYQRVGGPYTGIAAFYAKRHRAKLIWHIACDTDILLPPAPSFRKYITQLPSVKFLDYGIRHADIIIGQTNHQDTLLQKYYGRQCDAIIPNCHIIPEDKEKNSGEVCVLWIANMKHKKQPEVFVDLANELVGLDNVSFVMMGRPETGAKYSGLLDKINNTPNLKYLGEVSNDEVNSRLEAGHILVNTSHNEGFSNTFIQAWMRRVPVVSLNVDPDDILVNQGLGFCSGTVKRLCQDVSTLARNRTLREEMGARARAYASKSHAIEKVAKDIVQVFR